MAAALETMRRPPNPSPLETMQKAHKEAHPVELALIVAIAVGEAIAVLVVTLLALARWSPAAPPEPSPMAPPPAAHPLALVAAAAAEPLAALRVAELRRLARAAGLPRSLSRSGRRDALLSALVGLEVAACG